MYDALQKNMQKKLLMLIGWFFVLLSAIGLFLPVLPTTPFLILALALFANSSPKFHQMLHVCDYIERHGTPLNYDGSRGENFGKVIIKDNAKLTRKQKVAFNFDIGRRISEEDIIDNASNIFQRNKGYWPSEYCNDTDIAANANRIQTTNSRANKGVSDKPRYKLVCSMEHNENDNTGLNEKNITDRTLVEYDQT